MSDSTSPEFPAATADSAAATADPPAVSSPSPSPQVWPVLRARDPDALIRFLVDVIGFTQTVVYRDGDAVHHAELAWPPGGGIMLGPSPEGEAVHASLRPGSFSAYVVSDAVDAVDALHDRAVAAGATIVLAPYDTDYGSREFALEDPEGNRWSFGTWRGHPR
jgi:uncharacterized glyoxalase superfamily protein PhnB